MHLAVRYLARRDRTTAQVEQYLRAKGAAPVRVRRIVARLSDLRYLNDRAYAERWIEARLAGRPMSRERLEAELLAKGVAESVAGHAIRERLQGIDDETLARRVLSAARRAGRGLTLRQQVRLLRQRGFEEDTIDRMIGLRSEHGDSD
jgi:regulatory protein